jgi:hypothetical protein
MSDWEEQNKKMTKTGEGDDEKISAALDEGDIALLQVRSLSLLLLCSFLSSSFFFFNKFSVIFFLIFFFVPFYILF